MDVSLHFSALHYLNLWLSKERQFVERYQEPSQRRSALVDAAAHFRVARTLPKKHDAQARFASVERILDNLDAARIHSDPVRIVHEVNQSISKEYGNVSCLSFTTKMLWIKIRSPVIIYDRQARTALQKMTKNQSKLNDYDAFLNAWHVEFNQRRSHVEDACTSLINAMPYVVDPDVSKSEVDGWSTETWFHERVFDSYLWHRGS